MDKYQIYDRYDDVWINCKKAKPQPSGWLHYELSDGTNGVIPPERWRIKPKRTQAKEKP